MGATATGATAHAAAAPPFFGGGASDRFIDRKVRARIGIRILAEHHLAMHEDLHRAPRTSYLGIVNMKLSPASLVAHVHERAAVRTASRARSRHRVRA